MDWRCDRISRGKLRSLHATQHSSERVTTYAFSGVVVEFRSMDADSPRTEDFFSKSRQKSSSAAWCGGVGKNQLKVQFKHGLTGSASMAWRAGSSSTPSSGVTGVKRSGRGEGRAAADDPSVGLVGLPCGRAGVGTPLDRA